MRSSQYIIFFHEYVIYIDPFTNNNVWRAFSILFIRVKKKIDAMPLGKNMNCSKNLSVIHFKTYFALSYFCGFNWINLINWSLIKIRAFPFSQNLLLLFSLIRCDVSAMLMYLQVHVDNVSVMLMYQAACR